jgi:hypothetical protein
MPVDRSGAEGAGFVQVFDAPGRRGREGFLQVDVDPVFERDVVGAPVAVGDEFAPHAPVEDFFELEVLAVERRASTNCAFRPRREFEDVAGEFGPVGEDTAVT